MALSEQEREWALEIKRTVDEDPNQEPLNDFWYAQLALVDKGDLEKSLDRIDNLKHFWEEYGIVEDAGYGSRILRDFQRVLPEFWMCFEFNRHFGNYVLVCDVARFYVEPVEGDVDWLKAMYYVNHCLSPDLEAVRQGPVLLVENQGFDWKKNFGVNVFKRMYTDLMAFYPFRHKLIKNFHTGVFMNLVVSMSKPIIPKEMFNSYQMGCTCELGRLDRVYMKPSVRAANEKLLAATKMALEKRYANEASFKL